MYYEQYRLFLHISRTVNSFIRVATHMMTSSKYALFGALTLTTVLSACDGSGDIASTAEADISGTGTDGSSGNIDAFGSIFVNGVRYDTSSASVYIDGVLATEDDLKLGQIVTVTTASSSDANNAVAESVRYTPLLEGAILALRVK